VNPEDIVMAATASSFDAVASRRVATSTDVATAEASSQTAQAALRASVAAACACLRELRGCPPAAFTHLELFPILSDSIAPSAPAPPYPALPPPHISPGDA
jgi:hypothetical protein